MSCSACSARKISRVNHNTELQVDEGSSDQTVSGLAIAGIVIGSIALLLLIGYVYYYYKRTRRTTKSKKKYTFIYNHQHHVQ